MEFSRCARAELAYERKPARMAGLSKLNSKRLVVEVDVDLGEPEHGRITSGTRSIDKAGSHQ
jgi:hypothetical protein